MLPSYLGYIFVHLRQKSTSQDRIKPEIVANFGPEPGPNPTRKARPDVQLKNLGMWKHYISDF